MYNRSFFKKPSNNKFDSKGIEEPGSPIIISIGQSKDRMVDPAIIVDLCTKVLYYKFSLEIEVVQGIQL
jgi:hypothetical protein